MQTYKTTKIVSAALLSLLLAACGGGPNSPLDQYEETSSSNSASSTATSSNSNSSVNPETVDTTSPAKLGNGVGNSFVSGAIGTNTTNLSAGGTAVLVFNVVSSTNNLVTADVDITVTSTCVASGEAILKSGTTVTNKVTATNGEATLAYTANGCVGNDLITASASLNGKVVNAALVLSVAPDTVQTISFVDSSPNQISLKGTGGDETSVVRFQVLGSTGAPVKDIDIDFLLSSSVGGLSLTSTRVKTDKSGYASTTVQAGTIATSVRVTATDTNTNTSTTSNQLIVSTGIPDQKSMSLAATDTHPIGWDIQGVESTLTVRLADAFNNPPPANTAVAFTTEGGSIEDSCVTDARGACSVKWVSQNPKPVRNSAQDSVVRRLCVDNLGLDYLPDDEYETCKLERAGRVTVLATAIGNESFIDTNGNGLFDKNETHSDQFKVAADGGNCTPNVPASSAETPSNSPTIPCDDLQEAYLDKNENGERDSDEGFVDFNQDSLFSEQNDLYNGVLCTIANETNGDCSRSQVSIRQDMVLVMTSRDPLLDGNGELPFIDNHLTASIKGTPSAFTYFWLADVNGHGIGAGTTLSVNTSALSNASVGLSATGPLAASDHPRAIGITLTPTSTNDAPSGSFNVVITTPTILGNRIFQQTIRVN